MSQLTAKQRRFVQEYVADLNATQAAIRAGYAAGTARQQGNRLLTKVHIAEAVAETQTELAEKLQITAERVLQEYARIAFSDIRTIQRVENGQVHVADSRDWDDNAAAGVASISTRDTRDGIQTTVKLHDKQRALEALSKHLGLFKADNEQTSALIQLPRAVDLEERIQALLAPKGNAA